MDQYFSKLSQIILCEFMKLWNEHLTSLALARLNVLSQNEHLKGFSPVWICSCFLNWLGWINRLSQTSHLNLCEFSSLIWVLSWCFICDGSLNFLSQNLHGKGLSPVWTFSWCLKLPGFWNFFLQYLHVYFLLHSLTFLAKSRTSEQMDKALLKIECNENT